MEEKKTEGRCKGWKERIRQEGREVKKKKRGRTEGRKGRKEGRQTGRRIQLTEKDSFDVSIFLTSSLFL